MGNTNFRKRYVQLLIWSMCSLFSLGTVAYADNKAEVYIQVGHGDAIESVVYSPDSNWIASATESTVKIWDAHTGRNLHTLSFDSYARIKSIEFSPDSRLLAICSRQSVLFDLKRGEKLNLLRDSNMHVRTLSFSPDGNHLLLDGSHGTEMWNARTGTREAFFPSAEAPAKKSDADILDVAFMSDGEHFVTLDDYHLINLWSVKEKRVVRTFEHKGHFPKLMDVSKDGKMITGDNIKGVVVWSLKDGSILHNLMKDVPEVNAVAISANGKYVAYTKDGVIEIRETSTGSIKRSILVETSKQWKHAWVGAIAISPGGLHVAGGDQFTHSLGVWQIASGRKHLDLKGLASNQVEINSSDQYIVTRGESDLNAWDIKSGRLVTSASGNVDAVRFESDGTMLLVSVNGFYLMDTDPVRISPAKYNRLPQCAEKPYVFSPSGDKLAFSGCDKSVTLWDIKNGVSLWSFKNDRVKKESAENFIAFSPDGKWVLFSDNEGLFSADERSGAIRDDFAYLLDMASGKIVKSFIQPDNDQPDTESAFFTRDSKYVFAGMDSKDMAPQLWNVETGQLDPRFTGFSEHSNHPDHVGDSKAVAIDRSEQIAASGSRSVNSITLWELSTGKQIRQLHGHHLPLQSVLFNARGDRLISTSADNTTRVWSVPDGKELAQMVKFSNGEWIVVTPEGYYNASLNGHKYLNVRMGNKVYGIDQFYDVFYRPDIVRAKLAGEDISEMITLTLDEAIRNPPPDVSLLSAPEKSSKEMERISYQVDATGGGIGEVRVFHNGKLVKSDGFIRKPLESMMGSAAVAMNSSAIRRSLRGLTHAVEVQKLSKSPIITEPKDDPFASSIEIEPIAGENEVSIVAFNAQNSVQSLMKSVHFTSTRKPESPRLHILAIGIDKYLDKGSTLKFAARDARDMAAKFKEKAASTYGRNNVFMETLFDEQATRDGILARLDEIASKVKPTDHFVLFVASHGVLLGDQYYMVTHDYDGSLKADRLISSNEIVDLSKRIKALSQLYILDTCHAGGMDGVISGLYDARMSVLAKKMGLHIFASSNSFEEAMDGYKGNGLFTHNLLDGLNNNAKADANSDRNISLVELGKFSQSRTKAIAKELGHQQEPMIINFGQDRALYQLQ